jgi:hypothetical protein
MFRFHNAIGNSFHLAGLPLPGRKGQTRQVGSKESEHIYDNSYSLQIMTMSLHAMQYRVVHSLLYIHESSL